MTKPEDTGKLFLCGADPEHLTGADRKAIQNFRAFLKGKGTRCPRCLHKAKRHHSWCGVQNCDCQASQQGVRAWHSKTSRQ